MGEREEEKHQCVVASRSPPIGDLAHNPGMCPDGVLKWQPFGSQPTLSLLSYTSQGLILDLPSKICLILDVVDIRICNKKQ